MTGHDTLKAAEEHSADEIQAIKDDLSHRHRDLIASYRLLPGDQIVIKGKDLHERSAFGIRLFYEVMTGQPSSGPRHIPRFDISTRDDDVLITMFID